MTGYKFLKRGAVGAVSGFVWPRGEWVTVEEPLEECRRGIHVLRGADLAYWLSDELWRIEYDGDVQPGSDCIIASRARLVERVDGWSESGGADRFARAAYEHLIEQTKSAAADKRELVEGIISDASKHLPKHSTALAAYCAAMGVGRMSDDGQTERYRRERAWQSEWIVRDLSLDV
jgi:hypothetical protein